MRVLVTGALGLVGRATVAELLDRGAEVVATDLDTPDGRRAAAETAHPRLRHAWADLTDAVAVERLLARVRPDAVVHLAAVIPPRCYAVPAVARRVSVDGTRHLVAAAAALDAPPRLVHASSVAVHGPRNPHLHDDVLGADTALAPGDLYGQHKAEAEQAVRGSRLEWVVLRLGGVLTTAQDGGLDLDTLYFEGALPTDGRIQTVDVRDVARAFAAATEAPVAGRTLMIGGDDRTHRIRQGDIVPAFTAARGLTGGIPVGLPGDPASPTAWFATDWMDTAPAQDALDFQRHSWPDLVEEVRRSAGWSRFLLRLLAPPLHEYLRRRSAYAGQTRTYADPWGAIDARWGSHAPDRSLP
ncbi:NAD-dependent epimerase/dehydratase family protein [Nocardioides sp. SYSU DS0663]|uniref:NAD-dependent epimerase/dehydratase family protein n=1 Tax=Nocardioides sp. SYSU DS0663 TaxID=3416445 RepID=UPI003F4BBE0C